MTPTPIALFLHKRKGCRRSPKCINSATHVQSYLVSLCKPILLTIAHLLVCVLFSLVCNNNSRAGNFLEDGSKAFCLAGCRASALFARPAPGQPCRQFFPLFGGCKAGGLCPDRVIPGGSPEDTRICKPACCTRGARFGRGPTDGKMRVGHSSFLNVEEEAELRRRTIFRTQENGRRGCR